MAITSELIGRLGGGSEVESWDISTATLSRKTVLQTIPVTSGKTKLLIIMGQFSRGISSLESAYIQVGGGEKMAPYEGRRILATAQVLTRTADVVLNVNELSSNSFTGTFYLLDWEV